MRFYTQDEQGRRLLGWAGLAGAAIYAATSVVEIARSGATTAWWPVVAFWLAVAALSVRALTRSRHYTDIDLQRRTVRIVCGGTVTRELSLGQLAPLEIHQYVPVKQTKYSVRYGVRSQPFPEVAMGDEARQSQAERRLASLGVRLGLATTTVVVPSPDLTPDGRATWISADPEVGEDDQTA